MKVLPWASYRIRKTAGCACTGNAGKVFHRRRLQRKLLVSDPDMHHGTCVTHVPWCMSGSLTCGGRENDPGIPGACAPAILRILQEAHAKRLSMLRCISSTSYTIPTSVCCIMFYYSDIIVISSDGFMCLIDSYSPGQLHRHWSNGKLDFVPVR